MSRLFDDKSCDYKTKMKEKGKFDVGYKGRICDLAISETFQTRIKGRERDYDVNEHNDDDYDVEKTDPAYENVLKCLKEYGKSYVLEDGNDSMFLIAKYEEETSSGSECAPEPRRKLSALKNENGPSDQRTSGEIKLKHDPLSTPVKNTRSLTQRQLKEQAESIKTKIGNGETDEMELDNDYLSFMQNCIIVDDYLVFRYQEYDIVFDKIDGDCPEKMKRADDSDGSSSDMYILEGNSKPYEPDFRRRAIAELRKPYAAEEYDRLWHAINLSKPELQHKELRSGREISFLSEKKGKSFLQQYPDLKKRLEGLHDNKPKCLNLLRGFFFWLQNNPHDGAFIPWLDQECLSVSPGSC